MYNKTMSDDQFTKLFKYMEKRFDGVEKRFDAQDNKIDGIYNTLDQYLNKIEQLLEENTVRNRQYERLERWVHEIAEKTGVKLTHDF